MHFTWALLGVGGVSLWWCVPINSQPAGLQFKYQNVQWLHIRNIIIIIIILCLAAGTYMRNIAKCFIVLCRIVLSFRPLAHVKSSGVRLYFIDNINCPNVIITFYVICGESVNQSLMAPPRKQIDATYRVVKPGGWSSSSRHASICTYVHP